MQCIIPSKALNLLTRLAGDPEEPVRIAVTDNRVFFGFDDGDGAQETGQPRAVLSSALVEGAFPPYEDVIPKENDKKATAGREDLAAAVRQAAVLTNEESRGVRMHFSGKGRRVKLSSRAPEMGDSEIDLGLTEYAGDDLEICFNPHYLTDVLKTLDEDEVIVELKASNKPGLIRVGTDFLYVLMPVNLPA